MQAKTKATVTDKQLQEMVKIAGLGEMINFEELTGGEFNRAFKLQTPKGRFVLKIAPSKGTTTLRYEQGIMDVELWVYDAIKNKTSIPIPQILYSGNDVIDNQWFIMEELQGKLLYEAGLSKEEADRYQYQFGQKLAELHKIRNDAFGYMQMNLHPTWKDAYYDMVFSLIADGEDQGDIIPGVADVLRYIRKYEFALEAVKTPRLIHFDLFSNNIFADENKNFSGLIDTERCFWGDYYADFIAINSLGKFPHSTHFVNGYNEIAEEKIVFTVESHARVSLMRLYLGLVVCTEGTTRLPRHDPTFWRRKLWGINLIKMALSEMDDIS